MYYSEIGMVVAQNIDGIASHWSGVIVHSSVVMPNHVHLIISIDGKVYQMRNQIDKICKELLIKYKVFESVKNK